MVGTVFTFTLHAIDLDLLEFMPVRVEWGSQPKNPPKQTSEPLTQ